jgi:hypothetical protein
LRAARAAGIDAGPEHADNCFDVLLTPPRGLRLKRFVASLRGGFELVRDYVPSALSRSSTSS